MKLACFIFSALLLILPVPSGMAASEASAEPASSASTKMAVAEPLYRKKVTATRFHVVNSLQVEDIADIWSAYPLELLRRLEAAGGALPLNSVAALLPDGQPNPDSPANREMVRRIAEQHGSQFVVSGVILDAGADNDGVRRAERPWPWPNFKPEPSVRRLEVEIFLHDGVTGALILRHRDSAVASGRVMVGRNKPFASGVFLDTPFGQAVAQVLDAQVETVSAELARQPFMANIVRIEGRKIYIDAGGASGLAPGSRLTVYRKNPATPVHALAGQNMPGIPEASVSSLTLFQVQPLFAVGELATDPARINLQIGDFVRIEVPPIRTLDPARPDRG